jgi:biotin-dependent carboxylase-like uncharacterized protein
VGSLAILEILAPGPLTTVQDLGRFGFGRFGVAPSGALDAFSCRIANLLVGNPEKEAVLEITLSGFKARILKDLNIAVTGANLMPFINDAPLAMWQSRTVQAEDILSFRGIQNGCRAYLSMGGGIDVIPVMGSKATNLISGFGGFNGCALQKGDVLNGNPNARSFQNSNRFLAPEWIPVYSKEWTLRVLLGPQDDGFASDALKIFLQASYRVAPQSDRVGIRLSGPFIPRKVGTGESIISEGIVPGAIQITGEGQPIILLNETITGGYRKIATVISADLWILGQVKPGDQIFFEQVNLEQALLFFQEVERKINIFSILKSIGSKKYEFRQAGTGVPARSPE